MTTVSVRRGVTTRLPHIYLHKYASGLKFWRVVPFGLGGLTFKRLTIKERTLRTDAYDFVSKRNMDDYGKRGLYDT